MEAAMKFIGITKTDPTTLADNVGTVEIGDGNYQPKLNDMVVYGTKEYIWRQGQVPDPEDSTKTITVTRWFEIGDEEVPSWED